MWQITLLEKPWSYWFKPWWQNATIFLWGQWSCLTKCFSPLLHLLMAAAYLFFTYKNMPDILREVYAIQGTAGFMQIKQFSKGLFVIFSTSPRTFSLNVPVWPSVDSWEGDHCDSATLANMGWHAGDHWPGPHPRLPCNLQLVTLNYQKLCSLLYFPQDISAFQVTHLVCVFSVADTYLF